MTYTTPSGTTYSLFEDMLRQSHLLIAGASGSGKSVLVNGLVCTLLYRFPMDCANGAQMILLDPKRTELRPYKAVPHCIRYASEPRDMLDALHYAVGLTESRYKRMEKAGLRTYSGGDVYVVIEEFADLITTQKRTVQPLIQRLCQISRAARIHCLCATQSPLREILSTPIKCNFDGRVALRTRCAQDSRNIIGVNGAEQLPRYGECLYLTPDEIELQHYAVPYVTEEEQAALIKWWTRQRSLIARLRRQ